MTNEKILLRANDGGEEIVLRGGLAVGRFDANGMNEGAITIGESLHRVAELLDILVVIVIRRQTAAELNTDEGYCAVRAGNVAHDVHQNDVGDPQGFGDGSGWRRFRGRRGFGGCG